MSLRAVGSVVALALVLAAPLRARADTLGGPRDDPSVSDPMDGYRLTCVVCGDGWAVLMNVALVTDTFMFALDDTVPSTELAPIMAVTSAATLGFDAGILLLSAQSRPTEDWLIIFATRTLAALLAGVAAAQLPRQLSIPLAVVLTVGASLPQFLLEPAKY